MSISFFNFSTKVVVLLTFLYRADFFDTYYGRKGCRNITALLKVKNNRCGRFFLEIFWNLLEYCSPLKMSKNWENNMWVLPKDPLTFIEWKKRNWWKYRTIFYNVGENIENSISTTAGISPSPFIFTIPSRVCVGKLS